MSSEHPCRVDTDHQVRYAKISRAVFHAAVTATTRVRHLHRQNAADTMTDATNTPVDESLPGTVLESIPNPETASEIFDDYGIEYARVTFYAEEQHGDQIHRTGDTITYTVPIHSVLTDDGELIREETPRMDAVKSVPAAPVTVAEWDGPFEIYYDEFLDDTRYRAETAVVTFHPMIPLNGRLVVPDDTWTYRVPVSAVLDDDGNILEDDTAESDWLIHHQNAPTIAQQWCSVTDWCYKVTIDSVPDTVDAFREATNDS